nr:hypothetical protein BaRGS_020989 [Batillaria attramentaria]
MESNMRYFAEIGRSCSNQAKKDLHTSAVSTNVFDPDCSNSSWAEMEPYVIGSYSLQPPLTVTMKQRLILQYLAPMGDYQELLSSIFEYRAMDLIFFYINLSENSDVRLGFEALKYLATLLCHKKFAIEFLGREGVQRLLAVYRPSIAATGVALCLYYLSYFEDAMERVCLLPDHVLSDLVGQVFPFRVMLDLFDQRDGLRRLFNVISTLEILNVEESESSLNEDVIFAMRQAARHVCGALKKYFEAQLAIKAEEVRRSHIRSDGSSPTQETPAYKPLKLTPPVVAENIELLMELLPVRSLWRPEATFHKLGGLPLLIQLVAMAPEWANYPGKPETIKSALDVITVLTVTPKSQLTLLGNVKLPDNVTTPAISVLTGLAEGEVLAEAEVQKAALNILINCVCGPFERLGGGVGRFMGTGTKKKVNVRVGEDVLSRMWNGVRTNNGIMVLLKLLSIKIPITEADAIRALACKALVGLCRSETVKQIVSKLPIFNNGQLQSLMKEPILQDRRQEHVKFCKYASQLLERVSGKQSNTLDASLEDIRKADIVAQTKIMYHGKELMQLIHDHLVSKGLSETASVLQREAGLPRFLPFQTFRDKEDDGFASCCFSADEKYLMLGTFSGDLKMINMATGEEAGSLSCHNSPIIHMEPSRNGKTLLTSSWGVSQDSALWSMGTTLDCKFTFDDHLVEFSKISQDRIIGTKDETAHIYDAATGALIMTLYDPDKANNYRANMATFSPTDKLALNDGVLWDLRTKKPLHKFDKFNQYISGVFHPMGQEIIINSEVWDQRTFKLLHTVPALDQCQIKFNHTGDIIFATRVDDEGDSAEEARRTHFSSTLRTFDATDYSSIGTIDLKTRSIFDLCTDKFDFCLAVIEQNTQFTENGGEESICRLYEIGKLRDEEDDVQEEEEETEAVEDEEEEDEEDPSFLDFDASSQSEDDEDDGDNDNNDGADEDEDDEDGDDVVVEFSPGNTDDDDDGDDNDNDDLDDDMLFALV